MNWKDKAIRKMVGLNLGYGAFLGAMLIAVAMPPGVCVARVQSSEIGADASGTLELSKALEIAVENNPDLAAVARELTIAHGDLTKAEYLSPFNPTLQSEGDYRRRTDRSNTQDWRVGLSQEIEIFGQRSLRIESARLNLQEHRMLLADQRRLLLGAVKLTFLDALRARDHLKLLSELQALDSRLLAAARTRLDAGEIGQIDFNLAQVRYGESSRAVIEGRERYRRQRSSLGRLLGAAAGPEPSPIEVRQSLPDYRLEQMVASALKNRPDLSARQIEITRLENEMSLNRRLALPNLTLGAFGGHELNTEYPVGIQMGFSVPLFNRRTGEAEMLAGQIAQAKQMLRANRQDIEKQVRDAFNAYQAARESLTLYQDEVAQPAHESFALLEEAFTGGKIDLLRLSVAEREAFEARMRFFDVSFGASSARIALEIAAGVSS